MAKVAFIGLGVMGFPMAGHLAKAGHDIAVYNRTRAKAESWVAKHGGRWAGTPAEAAAGAELVFSCVGDDPDLRAVALGPDGSFQAMAKGAIHVDHTTASAAVARELAAEAEKRGTALANGNPVHLELTGKRDDEILERGSFFRAKRAPSPSATAPRPRPAPPRRPSGARCRRSRRR